VARLPFRLDRLTYGVRCSAEAKSLYPGMAERYNSDTTAIQQGLTSMGRARWYAFVRAPRLGDISIAVSPTIASLGLGLRAEDDLN
jgi:hypothetical protein